MPDRYPGYDVLAKRNTPSWNRKTREVIDKRLAVPREPRFFDPEEFATVMAIAARLVPQPNHRPPIPVASLVDEKLHHDKTDGYRFAPLPREREAWRLGLKALDAEARRMHGTPFHELEAATQDALLHRMQEGMLHDEAWAGMPPKLFFNQRMAHDIVMAYYSHPTAWSEIGWGGPAAPRGYVRMDFDKRDHWEAAEAKPGEEEAARKANLHVG